MAIGNMLYYGGIVLASCAVVLGIIAVIVFHSKSKRLKTELDREYGPRKR